MKSIDKLKQEAGLVVLVQVGRLMEKENENSEMLRRLEHQLHGEEQLSVATRNAFLLPTCNYGHRVCIISPDAALSEIKRSADSAMSATAPTLEPRAGAGAASEQVNPKLRRQFTHTVFGRDQVVEDLLKILLSEDASIRWVGAWAMGGAGKTFTAERLFNNPALQNHFTGGLFWVTVGCNTSISTVLRRLYTECVGSPPAGTFSDEDFKNRLCQKLGNRKNAVLFLDDVWSESILRWLDVLPAQGLNRVFVTTRNRHVLEREHAKMVEIQMLPVEDSWKLFCWYAFGGSEKVSADLEGVAREVADECKGLPLALRVIGSTFAGKRDGEEWQRLLEKLRKAEVLTEAHEKQLLLRLNLSLEELPDSRLVNCFLYFAAFPEDAEVKVVEDLLDAWVGEGIVQSGRDAYNDAFGLLGWLIARSLIEVHALKTMSYSGQVFMTCKVHDVLRDLARYVLQHNKEPHRRDCLYEPGMQLDCFPPEWIVTDNQLSACRLSLAFNSLTELPQQLKAPMLQVLRVGNNPLKELPSAFFKSFRGLKVLDLRKTNISKLPDMLGHNLKQLRILNLSSCEKLEMIPASAGEMRQLQRLNLSQCSKLSCLPSSLSKITSLQMLNLSSIAVWEDEEHTSSRFSFAKKRAALKDISD